MDEKKDGNFIEENEKEKTEMTADETPETRDAGKTADNGDRSGAAAEDDGADAGQTAENTETAAEAAETAAGAAKKAEDTETAADTGTAENAESVSGEGADLSAEEADDASAEEEAGTAADVSSGTYAEAASDVPYLLMCDKEAIEVQKILPFLSDTWPLCRIGRAVIRASQSCRQSCNKSQCPACGCRSHTITLTAMAPHNFLDAGPASRKLWCVPVSVIYDENGTRRQDIEIYYSFVGKIDLPE